MSFLDQHHDGITESARRMFRLSLVLVIAMALAAVTLSSVLRLNAPRSLGLNTVPDHHASFGRLVRLND